MPVKPFPAGVRTLEIDNGNATIHVRVVGEGPAIVLLHGSAKRATCGPC